MIIVWKWRNSNNKTPLREKAQGDYYDVLDIKGRPEYKLIRYDPPDAEASISVLREIIEKYSPNYTIQIFLHIGHHYKQEHVKDLPIRVSVEPPIFFGGGGHLYLSHYSPLGLLGAQGNMGGSIGTTSRKPVQSYVLEDEKIWIKEEHFNNVWNYYYHNFKRKIFVLKEDFIKVYLPWVLSKGDICDDERRQQIDERLGRLRSRGAENTAVLSVPLHEDTDKKSELDGPQTQIVYSSATILEGLADLQMNIEIFLNLSDHERRSISALWPLRDAFNRLLNQLPENTYD